MIIVDKIRCMFVELGLDKKFWVEAVFILVYLINRISSFVIEFKDIRRGVVRG